MRKILLLFVFAMGIISFANSQVIDLLGIGSNGLSTANLQFTDLSSIEHIDVGVVKSWGDPISATDVTFTNFIENGTTTLHTDIINQSILSINEFGYKEYLTASFSQVDGDGIDVTINDATYDYPSYIQSYYAFIYRNIPNSSYKSFASLETVYFYHNGSDKPYIYNIPINAALGPRNITVKIPISELAADNRPAIIDITAGSETAHAEVKTYSVLGNSLFIGEYTLTNVPGYVTNVEVSIYSPNNTIGIEADGDSFYVNGVVVDVDKVEEDCGECEGKVTSLEMQYNGSTGANIEVLGKKDGNEIFAGYIAPGGTFNLEGFDKKNTLGTEIIFLIDGVQNTKIHTSCSKPIGPGLISGDFEVLSGVSREGGILCPVETPPNGDCGECEGKVTWLEMQYNGNTDATILVLGKKEGNEIFAGNVAPGGTFDLTGFDKKGTLGTEIILYVDGVQNTKIHTSCSKPIGPGLISGDFEVLSGVSREGGILCPVDVPPTPPNGDCGECDGKATALELQNNGDSANIVVETKKNGESSGTKVVFNDFVDAGETFSFVGNDKKSTLGTEITIKVNGIVNTKIHTSCSQPLYIGLVSGDFNIVDGYSRNGGQLCETSNKNLNTASFDSCNGCGVVLTYPNPASDYATIKFIPNQSVHTKVVLYNLYGQSIDVLFNNVVEKGIENKIKLNVNKLSNGLYFVKIINGSSIHTERIMVNK